MCKLFLISATQMPLSIFMLLTYEWLLYYFWAVQLSPPALCVHSTAWMWFAERYFVWSTDNPELTDWPCGVVKRVKEGRKEREGRMDFKGPGKLFSHSVSFYEQCGVAFSAAVWAVWVISHQRLLYFCLCSSYWFEMGKSRKVMDLATVESKCDDSCWVDYLYCLLGEVFS